jgi:hypothetical protein
MPLKLIRALSRLCGLAAAAALLVWLISRIESDRALWSQYLFWIPTWLILMGSGGCLILSHLLARFQPPRRRSRSWGSARRYTGLAWLAALVWFGVVELRLLNLLTRSAPGAALKIMHWNATGVHEAETVPALVRAENPDIAVLVNTGTRRGDALIRSYGNTIAMARDMGILVISKHSIRSYGSCLLDLDRVPVETPIDWTPLPSQNDSGRAMFLEIDTTAALGRPIVLWVLDMPSDWRKSRWKMAKNGANAIQAWQGPRIARDDLGQTHQELVQKFGFPAPDIVVGDMNIPRGSASLRLLAPGMTHAFNQGGAGFAGTFPRNRPLLHIDHTFLGRGLRAARYRIADPGPDSAHRAQVTEIVPR